VGNKTDVGGSVVPPEELAAFRDQRAGIPVHFTSARSREGLEGLLDEILRRIDWGALVPQVDAPAVQRVRAFLRAAAQTQALVPTAHLNRDLARATGLDPLEVQAVVDQLESQHLVMRGAEHTNLAPERVSKEVAKLVRRAADAGGAVTAGDVAGLKLDEGTRGLLMAYLVAEERCIPVSPDRWVFPSVVHTRAAELDEQTRAILASAPVEETVACEGVGAAGPALFHRFQALFSREHGPAQQHAEMFAVWVTGAGKERTALLATVVPGAQRSLVRIKAGGAHGAALARAAAGVLGDLNRVH
jgi:hypothetical protein